MGAPHANRLWLLGGAVAIIVIVAATFLLAIKPIYSEKSDLQGQSEDQDIQLVELKHQLTELAAKSEKLATYQAQLTTKEAALPEKYEMPAFLRALQTSEKSVTVTVSAVGISAPQSVNGSTAVYSVPITLTISGKVANVTNVIKRIQNVQSRAVLITGVTLAVTGGTATANLVLNAFCRKSDTCAVAG